MTYPDSVRFLYSLGNEIKTAKLGLDSIAKLLAELGNPHASLGFVHVAGTNGKGSVAAMIESGLRAGGIRTGLFTSPHLLEPVERIQIDGRPVDAGVFSAAFERVHAAAEALIARGVFEFHPTYFETVTAMALLIFQERGVECAVLEVGLGGRLDATNVVTPRLAVITAVDFDHEALLGRGLEAIAAEKAGILKPGIPGVFARQRPEVSGVLDRAAASAGAPVHRAADWRVEDLVLRPDGCSFRALGASDFEIDCPLAGEHQVENALAAAIALDTLGLAKTAIREGIRRTRWPGRLQRISESPQIIVDGAHNPAGARALAAHLDRFYGGKRICLIYGAMRDKAVEEVAGILFPKAARLILTAVAQARAVRPEVIRDLAGYPEAEISPSVAEALDSFRRTATGEDVAFVTGSLFLVGEALRHVT